MLREIRDFGDTKGNLTVHPVAFEWHMQINREICQSDGSPTGRILFPGFINKG